MKLKALLINDTNLVCHHGCSLLMHQIYKTFKENKEKKRAGNDLVTII